MNQSYTEPVTNSSNISFLGEAGDKIKFSFASDIESGELDIVLYDSEENVVYELDRAKELETFYVLNNSDTYTLGAEYSDFVGKFKIKVYKVDQNKSLRENQSIIITCQYSDYSPYGNDDYGTMLCYKKHKSEYLKVNDKYSYFEYLEGVECEVRQETYLCDEYEKRNQCEGYQGFVEQVLQSLIFYWNYNQTEFRKEKKQVVDIISSKVEQSLC